MKTKFSLALILSCLISLKTKSGEFTFEKINQIPNSIEQENNIDIRVAIMNGETETIKDFIKNNPSEIDKKDVFGWTMLHDAAFYGQLEIVKLLIQNGTNIKVTNIKNETAYQLARKRGFIKIAELIEKT